MNVTTYTEDHPLRQDLTLLEASAGTGKTYSVTFLYLRLLLEKQLDPSQIVVVTFTRAAAAELRERIHARLGDAERAVVRIQSQTPQDDSEEERKLRAILERAQLADPLDHIVRARANLDAGRISTIHTFASALTDEFAMASGAPSSTRLIDNVDDLISEAYLDLQYSLVERYPPELKEFVNNRKIVEETQKLARAFVNDPDLLPFPRPLYEDLFAATDGERFAAFWDENGGDDDLSEAAFARALRGMDTFVGEFSKEFEAIQQSYRVWLETNAKALNGTKFRKDSITKNLDLIGEACAHVNAGDEGERVARFNEVAEKVELKYFRSEYIEEGAKKGLSAEPWEHSERFDRLAALASNRAPITDYFIQKLALQVRAVTLSRLKERGLRSFSDIISDVHDALQGEHSHAFIHAVRNKYKAALIDEFQDTDTRQWEIFRALFGQESYTYLIGDPKQAIYAFRGANIAVYEQIRDGLRADQRMTLKTNYRSDAAYNEAVNQLFLGPENTEALSVATASFVKQYTPVDTPQRTVARRLRWPVDLLPIQGQTITGDASVDGALTLRQYQSETSNKSADITDWAIQHAAEEIACALSDPSRGVIFESDAWRGLVPSDCAVIVRSRAQGVAAMQALRRRGVPAVVRSMESVTLSSAADGILQWLNAIENPADLRRMRSFLVSPLIGLSLNELLQLPDEDLIAWSRFLADIQERWWRDGFLRSFERTLHTTRKPKLESTKKRGFGGTIAPLVVNTDAANDTPTNEDETSILATILQRVDGERIAADLMHLAEIIHAIQARQKLSPLGVQTWLQLKRTEHREGVGISDEFKERIESDGENVQIITAHASKGLEYPLVWVIGVTESHSEYTYLVDPSDHTRRYPQSASVKHAIKEGWPSTSDSDALSTHSPKVEHRLAQRLAQALPPLVFPSLADAPLRLRNEDVRPRFAIAESAAASQSAVDADELRLLYVALTRARLRCVVYLGAVAKTGARELLAPHSLTDGASDQKKLLAQSLAPDPAGTGALARSTPWPAESFRLEQWDRESAPLHTNATRYIDRRYDGLSPTVLSAPTVQRTRDLMTSFSAMSTLLPDHFAEASPTQPAAITPMAQRDDHDDRAHDELTLDAQRDAILSSQSALAANVSEDGDTSSSDIFETGGGKEGIEGEDSAGALPALVTSSTSATGVNHALPLADFQSGKDAGTALHRVFEVIDFSPALHATDAVRNDYLASIEQELPAFGLNAERYGALLADGVIAVLQTPLRGPLGNYTLAQLQRKDRLDELEFTMMIGNRHAAADLRGVFEALQGRRGDPQIPLSWFDDLASTRATEARIQGMMLGFIDLVFRADVDGEPRYFVADYKSNRLTPTGEAIHAQRFAPEHLRDEMAHHHYYLQYHIYLLALHRWLSTRLENYDYDRHIGGAYYLFVRGMTGATTEHQGDETFGVFFDRPPKAIIEALDAALRKVDTNAYALTEGTP